jgi:hypothetical protein
VTGLLWLLLTGEIPTKKQVDGLTKELRRREAIPAEVVGLINQIPKYGNLGVFLFRSLHGHLTRTVAGAPTR